MLWITRKSYCIGLEYNNSFFCCSYESKVSSDYEKDSLTDGRNMYKIVI